MIKWNDCIVKSHRMPPLRNSMDRIPTARPSWTNEMRAAAVATLDTKNWVKGPKGKEFGQRFAEHCGALVAVPCQNGSSSLWAALRILGVGEGDEVIVPSYTFISSATAISLVGATAVFVDVEEDYWCLDIDEVKKAITEKTKAVIGVHLFGQPYDPRLFDLCREKGIFLIEDAAQAHGASQQFSDGVERVAGSMGDIGSFSFFPSKNMAVGGEGGMLTTTVEGLTDKVSSVVNHGRSPSLESMQLGSNLRMSEVSAAIGIVQLKHLDKWVARRREIAQQYNEAFADLTLVETPKTRPGAKHAWHQYCLSTNYPDQLVKHMDGHEIDARIYYPTPCHKQAVFANHPQHEDILPITDKLSKSLVAIPVMHELTDIEVQRVIEAVVTFSAN